MSSNEQVARLGRNVKEYISEIEEFSARYLVAGVREKWEEPRVDAGGGLLLDDTEATGGGDGSCA